MPETKISEDMAGCAGCMIVTVCCLVVFAIACFIVAIAVRIA